MKKILSIISFAVLAVALSVTAFAAEVIDSGYCGGEGDGTNLEWSLTEDGTLTISGEGAMADYDDYNNFVPWKNYSSQIKKLILGSEITTIGECAFKNCSNLTGSLMVEDGLVSIGANAFYNCGINDYYFKGNAPSVCQATNSKASFDYVEDTIHYPDVDETWEIVEEEWFGYFVEIWSGGFSFGDINEDHDINVKDVYYARLISAKLYKESKNNTILGDVDGDGKVSAIDANLIRKYAANIITDYPSDCEHNHLFGKTINVREALCEEDGIEKRVCLCGEKEISNTEALGHIEKILEAVSPTCSEIGLTEGKYCLRCGNVIVAQEEIEMLDHVYYKEVVIEPTETSEGYTEHYCECGHVMRDNYVKALASLGLEYEMVENRYLGTICSITGIGTCTDTDIIIPSKIEGKWVKIIGENAFNDEDTIISLTIPTSVNKIEKFAFFDCDILKKVVMPNIISIGEGAFARCFNLEDVVLPNSLDVIEIDAFGACESLRTIVIPYDVSKIKANAFVLCDNLTIYCERDSKPLGWSDDWNFRNYDGSYCPVVWNYRKEGDDRVIHSFGEWYVEEEATETTGKLMRRDCEVCGEYETYQYEKIKIYYGVSTLADLTDLSVLECRYLEYKEEPLTVYAGSGEYIYFCSPVEYGECVFFIGGWEYQTSHVKQVVVDGVDYYIYRFEHPGLGTVTFYAT